MAVKYVMCVLLLGGISCLPTELLADVDESSVSIMIEQPLHVLGVDGGDALIVPGVYTIEAAETWLRFVPGERRDAMLIEAERVVHQETLTQPMVKVTAVDGHLQEIVLLLPDGTGLKALGTYSGVTSRGLPGKKANRFALRAPATSSPKSTPRAQEQKTGVMKKKREGGILVPDDPWDKLLLDLIQQQGQRIKRLQAEIKGLQDKVAKLKNHHHDYRRTRTGDGGKTWVKISHLRTMMKDGGLHNIDDWGIYFRRGPFKRYPADQTSEPQY